MALEEPVFILFIINPVSGGITKTDWEMAIKQFFIPLEPNIDLFVLGQEDNSDSIKQLIEKIKPNRVVAVGGDGTVSMVAKAVIGTDIALGILPAGSANGMARELDIPLTQDEAFQVIAKGNIKNADAINVNDNICLHLSDIGLNALLIKHFEEGNLRGRLGYLTKVIKTLMAKSVMTVKINIGDKVEKVKALMVVLANARKYGTNAMINPEGNVFDGHFEVVIMKRLAISELWKMWVRPGAFDPEKIKLFPATSVSIETSRKVDFQVDGEYLGKVRRIEANIIPGQLKLIVP